MCVHLRLKTSSCRQIDNVEKNAHWLSWCSTIRFTCLDKSSPHTHTGSSAAAPEVSLVQCMTLWIIPHTPWALSQLLAWVEVVFSYLFGSQQLTPPLPRCAEMRMKISQRIYSRYNTSLKVKSFHFPLPSNGPRGNKYCTSHWTRARETHKFAKSVQAVSLSVCAKVFFEAIKWFS